MVKIKLGKPGYTGQKYRSMQDSNLRLGKLRIKIPRANLYTNRPSRHAWCSLRCYFKIYESITGPVCIVLKVYSSDTPSFFMFSPFFQAINMVNRNSTCLCCLLVFFPIFYNYMLPFLVEILMGQEGLLVSYFCDQPLSTQPCILQGFITPMTETAYYINTILIQCAHEDF